MPLFERQPLESGDALLKERWAQEGSTVVNITDSAALDETLYTVTTGKKLFITTLILSEANAESAAVNTLKDGGSSGTEVFTCVFDPPGSLILHNMAPLVFETDVYIDSAGNKGITLIGWEEDA